MAYISISMNETCLHNLQNSFNLFKIILFMQSDYNLCKYILINFLLLQHVKRPVGQRSVPLKYARQSMVKGGKRLPKNARQVPIRHAPGARRDDNGKKDEKSGGEKSEEEGGDDEEEGEEMKFNIPYLSSQDITEGRKLMTMTILSIQMCLLEKLGHLKL